MEYEIKELRNAGGASLGFLRSRWPERIGNLGRNVLRGDGIATYLSGLEVYAAVCRRHKLQFRADFFNLTIRATTVFPSAPSPIPPGSSNEGSTDGVPKNLLRLKYSF